MSETPRSIADLSPEEKRAYLAQLLRKKAGAQAAERANGERPAAGSNADSSISTLSHGQRALWFLHQLAPASVAYNLFYTARIRPPLDIAALRRSAQALVQRHPILSATFTMRNGEPVQHFHPAQKMPVELIDASTWSRGQLEEELRAEGDRPFDLEHGPVLRFKLFALAEQDYMLVMTAHHIAVDFWSLDLLVTEICVLYAKEVGAPLSDAMQAMLSQRIPQYTDYIRWQAELLAGPEGEQLWTHWQQELAGELSLLNLPLDRPRPPVQTYRGASHTFELGEDLSKQLKALAGAEKVTLYMLLLAVFQVLLLHYTDQDDILVGTPMVGRSRSELERIIGYLTNPVVLRTNLSGNPTFKELLVRVRHAVIAALEHQDYPFSLLVERLQPKRDASYSPIFQVVFVWDRPGILQNQENARLDQQTLKLEPLLVAQQGSAFDLTLRMSEVRGSLSADLSYNVDLFDAATIARMEQHFRTLLAGIVADPGQRISHLPLLTETEQQQLLATWNNTRSYFPEHMCIHQLIEEQVQRTPEAEAVVFEDQKLTYSELNRRANTLAHILQASGVGPDVLVGVCMERSLEMVIALLAILKAGGAYVPLDPTYPRERLDYMIQDAQMPVLLTQAHLLELLPGDGTRIICLDAGEYGSTAESEEDPLSTVQPDNLAYMIYTSGSTGKPKGVMNSHKGLCNRLYWMQQAYQLTPADRVMQKTPFSFDVSVWEFFWPLMTGACLVVARPGGHQDSSYLISLIAQQQITTLHFVPSMLQVFLSDQGLERCRCLKRVFCSGEALPFELQERFFTHFDAAETALHNLYGPTEAAIDVTYWQCQPGSHDWVVPIGRPIANTQIYILDRLMRPVPIGVPGELYIGGAGVARGYFNRPELTAEKFVPDPFSNVSGARLFKTADLARYRPDGAIEFLGRIDHQVKIRGFRIELGEIEVVLAQHPAIKEVVVLAREDTPGNKRLVAYLVPPQGVADPPVEELRAYLKEKLPHYMIPAAFVFLEALPLMPNGKVNRRALPAPDLVRPQLETAFVGPRNHAEEVLAKIWTQVLGIDKVGIHDNFFDLGGASIQSLQIITQAGEAGLQLTPELLFEYQTIAELAAVAVPVATAQPSPVLSREQDGNNGIPNPQAGGSIIPQPPQAGMGNTIIESIGVYLPPKAVSTREVLEQCYKPVNFPLEQLTGIHTRRMAGETEFSIDLAKQAVANCLANSRYYPEDIDLLICSNISRCDGPNFHVPFEPSTSMRLKQHFGFSNALVFDISNACTGMFTAINIVDAFLKAGLIRRGMVVSGEYTTHLTKTAQKEIENYLDSRLACLTVGDAGAAVILEQAAGNRVGFHELELYTLGRYSDYCIAKATDKEHGGAIMYTDSVKVSAVNIQQAVSHAAYTLERSGWPPEAFQHIIMHQTSRMTLNDASREINSYFKREICTQENVINNITDRGNTATTTHFVALVDGILANTIKSGENVIFGITGSGATIGTALYTFDDLPDRLRLAALNSRQPAKVAERTGSKTSVVLHPAPANTRRVRVESIGMPTVRGEKKALELAVAAAENCLEKSSYSRSDINLLIYTGVYRDDYLCEPALASMVAGDLEMNDAIDSQLQKKTFAFDLLNGASGFLNACQVATGMIQAQKMKSAMIVTAEIENNLKVLPTELRGLQETGSALILDQSADGKTGFGDFVFKYFPDYIEAFTSATLVSDGDTSMHFAKDPHIEARYLQCIRDTVEELLDIEQLDLTQVKVILPPQISLAFIDRLSDELGVDRNRCVDAVRDEGDLFTSSLPYALQQVREQNLVQPGDVGLIIAVGAGIQVGCATYHF